MYYPYKTFVRIFKRKQSLRRLSLGLNGRIKLKLIFKKVGREIVDWIHLAQDRDYWRAVVNTVMKLLFS
jgi:hypothetical protein